MVSSRLTPLARLTSLVLALSPIQTYGFNIGSNENVCWIILVILALLLTVAHYLGSSVSSCETWFICI